MTDQDHHDEDRLTDERPWANLQELEIWACARAVEVNYGQDGPRHIAERIGELALSGDTAGVVTWKRIASAYDALIDGGKTKQ